MREIERRQGYDAMARDEEYGPMTDEGLVHQLRNSKGWPTLGNAAADRIEALKAEVEGTLAVIAVERADLLPQWQPIETAPKDRRSFMVYIPQFNNGPLILSSISRDEEGGWWDDAMGEQIEPPEATHWMPTLAPPTE
jgi:hypothetical protein